MGIRDAGKIIREARHNAGLTLEELSEGICTLASLSYIENGKKGVCPSTFQALMSKAGMPCEAYPIFRNRDDFNAFIYLKNIRLYLDNWCIQSAYKEFINLQSISYGGNRFYYQEALYLYALILYKSHSFEKEYILEILTKVFSINRKEFSLDNLKNTYLNDVETEALLLLSHIKLGLNETDDVERILTFFKDNTIKEKPIDHYDAYFTALWNYAYSKYMYSRGDYEKAKEHIDTARSLSIKGNRNSYRLEILLYKLFFDTLNGITDAISGIEYLLYTADHLECGFIEDFVSLLKSHDINISFERSAKDPSYNFSHFPFDEDWESMSDGVFDIYGKDVVTIGSLIGDLRKEQRISLTDLCNGLCSASKLSKIEHREQEPSIFLAEALLNRLGFSERNFVFYGNKKESHYSVIKNELITLHRMGENNQAKIKEIVEKNINDSEPAIRQLCILFANVYSTGTTEQLDSLFTALKLTLPDFEISKITSYKLTWAEITILNNIIIKYIILGEIENAFEISKKLVEYSSNSISNIGFYDITLSASFSLYLRCFYRLSKYSSIIALTNEIRSSFYGKSLNNSGNLYYYYSQALGESGEIADMIKYGKISVGYFMLFNNETSVLNLKRAILQDFGIEI